MYPKVLSSFTRLQIISDLYDFLLWDTKEEILNRRVLSQNILFRVPHKNHTDLEQHKGD